jgi:hypothetical protein
LSTANPLSFLARTASHHCNGEGAMRAYSALLFFCLVSISFSHTVKAACGERGGPAFRGPNGKCVGWASLNSVCGNPPTSRCTYEGGGVGDTGKEKGGAFIAGMLPGISLKPSTPPSNFHIRKIQGRRHCLLVAACDCACCGSLHNPRGWPGVQSAGGECYLVWPVRQARSRH